MSSSTVQYKQKRWDEYVPPATSYYYNALLPGIANKAQTDQGLTPKQRSVYTGNIMGNVARTYGGAQKNLLGSLARSGARGPDVTESLSNLERSKAESRASGLFGLEKLDVDQQQQNMNNFLAMMGIPRNPVTSDVFTYGHEPDPPKSGGS